MQPLRWYALKVFYNRFDGLKNQLERDGATTYLPMKRVLSRLPDGRVAKKQVPLVAMLMFVRCDEAYIESFAQSIRSQALVYCRPGTHTACPIPDAEMDSFILLTTTRQDSFDAQPYNATLLPPGEQRYRVMEGEYSGIEGYYKRIENQRRLVVPLSNLLMLVSEATSPSGICRWYNVGVISKKSTGLSTKKSRCFGMIYWSVNSPSYSLPGREM